MDDLRQRILDYCYYCNKSKSQFAKMFGMDAKQFKNWKNDQRNHTGEVPPKNADKIKAYFK